MGYLLLSRITLLDGCCCLCLSVPLSCFTTTIEKDSSFALIGSIAGSLTAATIKTLFHQSSSKPQRLQVVALTVGSIAITRSAHCSDIVKYSIT